MRINNSSRTLAFQLLFLLGKPFLSFCSETPKNEILHQIDPVEVSAYTPVEVHTAQKIPHTIILQNDVAKYPAVSNDSPISRFFAYTYFYLFLALFAIASLAGCKKFVEVDPPPNVLISSTVYNSDASAIAAMSSIYTKFASLQTVLFSLYPGYSSDEFNNTSTSPTEIQFFTNGLQTNNGTISSMWNGAYTYIYQTNALLEGLQKSSGVNAVVKTQLNGEAKFVRAFLYYYLVNLYGDVPLITSTDYNVNGLAPRTPKAKVFDQIIADLKDAESLLSATYLGGDLVAPSTERLRPTKAAARAMLARVYLYQSDWASAGSYASSIISSGVYSLNTTDLTKVWSRTSNEAIWQMSTNPSYNTYEGTRFIATATPSYAALSTWLLNAFEPNDKRLQNWVGSVTANGTTYKYPYKYRVQNSTTVTEYVMMLRYAEIFLIRAEAYARQNQLVEAIGDLNTIRTRAGLLPLALTLTRPQVIAAIEQEHRIEMFSEWGDRWLFLKRTGRVDAVMTTITPLKGGGAWNTNFQLYPIPQSERNVDPNLSQNDGY